MSEDETLRMAAKVVDEFSGPLKNMQKSLRALSDQLGRTHKAGADQAKDQTKRVDQLHDSVRNVAERVRGSLAPAMATLGVSSVSAAAGIAAVAAAAKEFGGTARHFADLSKETGLSIQQLRVWEALAERVGSSSEAMDAGLQGFVASMEQLRRNRGELSVWLQSSIPEVAAIGRAMHDTTDNTTALAMAMKLLGAIPDPQQKRYFLEQLHLPLELATKSAKELADWYDELNRKIKPLTQAQIDAGKAAELAFDRLREAYRELKDQIGAGLAPAITRMTDAIRQFVEANQNGLIRVLDDIAKGIEQADWKGFAYGAKEAAAGVRMILDLKGELEKDKIDWEEVLNVAGMKTSIEDFTTFYKLQWSELKDAITNGNTESAGTKALKEKLKGLEPAGTESSADRALGRIQQHQQDQDAARKGTEEGAKKGVIDGLREWFHLESYTGGGGGGAQLIRASYSPGGGFGGGGLRGGTAGSTPMGAPARSGGNAGGGVDAVRRALGGDGGGGGDTSLSGNAFLQSQRARFGTEFERNPELKKRVAALIDLENPKAGIAVVESLMNRMAYAQGTMASGTAGGPHSFYGPARNPGMVEARLRELERDPKRMAARMAQIDAALAGSNVTTGYTDQGSRGDQNYDSGGVGVNINGERFNLWGGGPGGRAGAARFREAQQAQVLKSMSAAHKNAFIEAARAYHGHFHRPPARRDLTSGDLFGSARKAGLVGGAWPKVTGEASLEVNVNAPRGTTTRAEASGMFKSVKLRRGMTPFADQEA